VVGGLGLVSAVDFTADAITKISGLSKCRNLVSYTHTGEALYTVNFSQLPPSIRTIVTGIVTPAAGSLSEISQINTLNVSGVGVVGKISDLVAYTGQSLLLRGTRVLASSIAGLNLSTIRDINVSNVGWDNSDADHDADTVIDSIYQNRTSIGYATPTLEILTSNSAPSGDYVDPLVTPGSGNTDANWFWDGAVNHHWPLLGNPKRWYLTYGPSVGGNPDAFSRWVIT